MITGTSYFFDYSRDRMTALNATADRLQQEISTGKKVIAPGDNPAGWQRLQTLVQAKADGKAYAGNVTMAKGVLEQTDATLRTVQTQLGRANELAVRANNGTLSAPDRAAVAEELAAIVADLGALADTTDTRGQPLFDAAASAIPIGEGVDVVVNTDRTRVFGTVIADLDAYVTQLRNPTADIPASSATAITAIKSAIDNVATQQGSVGARAARVTLFEGAAKDAALMVESQRSATEDADPYETYIELQKVITILSATQQSFGKLSQLSLYDYLR